MWSHSYLYMGRWLRCHSCWIPTLRPFPLWFTRARSVVSSTVHLSTTDVVPRNPPATARLRFQTTKTQKNSRYREPQRQTTTHTPHKAATLVSTRVRLEPVWPWCLFLILQSSLWSFRALCHASSSSSFVPYISNSTPQTTGQVRGLRCFFPFDTTGRCASW